MSHKYETKVKRRKEDDLLDYYSRLFSSPQNSILLVKEQTRHTKEEDTYNFLQ
jgi:hypothetical protein